MFYYGTINRYVLFFNLKIQYYVVYNAGQIKIFQMTPMMYIIQYKIYNMIDTFLGIYNMHNPVYQNFYCRFQKIRIYIFKVPSYVRVSFQENIIITTIIFHAKNNLFAALCFAHYFEFDFQINSKLMQEQLFHKVDLIYPIYVKQNFTCQLY